MVWPAYLDVPQILEALPYAVEGGLRLPIVYNTSAYDSLESLRLMEGIVDIYMPDFKYWDSEASARFLKAKDYPERARAAIQEMHRQVGDLEVDQDSRLAKRGLLVRHLVMPDGMVVRQPEKYAALNRRISASEHAEALRLARAAGLNRIDQREPHPRLLGRRATLSV